ncbi:MULTISPECIES: hypothetical protein [unclassified Streptomyces]|uniref:hypothetical protein n=1 Tax=unclassified Streptomyces TaxID=2593676 RepID=UPI0032518C3A
MPHTTTAATPKSRRRPTPTAADAKRPTSNTTTVMPLWQALAVLFAPTDGGVRP